MELQRMIARFVAEPAPFTQQALYLARRSILDTMGAMIAAVSLPAIIAPMVSRMDRRAR